MNILFLDVETTGQDPEKHSIVQLAAEYHVKGTKVSNFSTNLNRGSSTDLGALKYNGLSLSDVIIPNSSISNTDEDKIVSFVDYILNIARSTKEPIYIGGHNVDFDINFINALLKDHGISGLNSLFSYRKVDTSTIALFLKSVGIITSENLSLSTLSKDLGIDLTPANPDGDKITALGSATFHNAIYDVAVTAAVLYKLQSIAAGLVGVRRTSEG